MPTGTLNLIERDAVAADRVVRLADADRHRDTQFVDLRVVPFVVKAQSCRDAGEEGVVVLSARGVRGAQDLSQRELEDVVVPGQVALGHDRRQRVGHRRDEARDRLAGRDRLGDGFAGVPQRVRHVADRGGEVTLGEVEQLRPVVAERIPGQIDGAEALAHRRLGHRSEVAGVGFDVEQQSRNVHATDAIGQRVVKLHHERRLAALEPLDERELPQRPITIEARHPGLASELQDRRQRLGGCRLEPANVPRQVEIGIDDPAGRGQPQRRQHDPVPKPRRQPRAALEPFRQPIPVRAADPGAGRTQPSTAAAGPSPCTRRTRHCRACAPRRALATRHSPSHPLSSTLFRARRLSTPADESATHKAYHQRLGLYSSASIRSAQMRTPLKGHSQNLRGCAIEVGQRSPRCARQPSAPPASGGMRIAR